MEGFEECLEYHFETETQFWSELADVISISPISSLDRLDYALRNYVALTSRYLDEYLAAKGALDHALFALLDSPLFTSHVDRMTANIIACIHPSATSSALFVPLMLILHLGLSNPLEPSEAILHNAPQLERSSKVFKAMRRRWGDVVPVLMKCVLDADVVDGHTEAGKSKEERKLMMPATGWEERVGTTAAMVLYEVCRVQKLGTAELSLFAYDFISHLFTLVERTRDAEDETFNYGLIKLIIVLNEQFMVSSIPVTSHHGRGTLPPPILPTILGKRKEERDPNLVLDVLKRRNGESKTFGENIIFILNRANGSPDSLCVSLLILKILYVLFTTPGTEEYFYTNDLCVLVDVFLRELSDLGEESEGLKHTYLRVLHPLLSNTQLRHHPYKRPLLRRVLTSLVSNTSYREPDPTTRRLVERNLRGSWCEGLGDDPACDGVRKTARGASSESESARGKGWSSGMGAERVGLLVRGTESTLSVDAVAGAEPTRRMPSRSESPQTLPSVPEGMSSLAPPHRQRSASLLSPLPVHPHHRTTSSPSTPSPPPSPEAAPRRRRAPPPPETRRRPAPDPPRWREVDELGEKVRGVVL